MSCSTTSTHCLSKYVSLWFVSITNDAVGKEQPLMVPSCSISAKLAGFPEMVDFKTLYPPPVIL